VGRWNRRVDDNQPDIVKALRGCGCSVAITSNLGEGFPDIVVGICGKNYLIEIKNGDLPPSARKLTDDEREFMQGWCGQYSIIESVGEAIKFVSAVRKL